MAGVLDQYQPIIAQAAARYGLDPRLIGAQILVESQGNPNAVSPQGAIGLMQLMPDTAKGLGVDNPADPAQNIMGGAAYMRRNIDKFGNVDNAVLAYHGGDDQANWGPKTQKYYRDVSEAFQAMGAQPQTIAQNNSSAPDVGAGALLQSLQQQPSAPVAAQGAPTSATSHPVDVGAANLLQSLQGAPAAPAAAQPAPQVTPAAAPAAAETPQTLALPIANDQAQFGANPPDEQFPSLAQAAIHAGLDKLPFEGMLGVPQVGRFLTGVAGGLDTLANSGRLMLTSGTDALGLTSGAHQRVEDQVKARNAQYAQALGDNPMAQAGKFAGEVGGSLMLTPQIKAAGWLARLGNGLIASGEGGALMSSNNPDIPVAKQAALSAALGTPLAVLAPPVAGWLGSQAARFRSGQYADALLSDATSAAPTSMNAAEVAARQAQGAPNPVAAALPSGAPLPQGPATPYAVPEATNTARARAQDFADLGLTGERGPTAGMTTRDPKLWQAEQEAAKRTPIGDPLTTRFQNINQGLREALDNVRGGTLGAEGTPYTVGQDVQKAIQAKYGEMQQQVSGLYTQIRKTVGDNPAMRPQQLMQTLDQEGVNVAADPIIGTVKRQLTRLGVLDAEGNQTARKLTVDEAEGVRKLINQQTTSGDANLDRIKRNLIDSLDNDVIDQSGVDAFKNARDAAAARFKEFEANKLNQIATDKMHPERIIKEAVTGGTMEDLQAVKNSLTTGTAEQVARGTQAWNDVRGQVVDSLIAKAFGTTGKFSPRDFIQGLNQIGPDRLGVIFSPDELARLGTISRVGSNAFSDVPFSAVNHSNTAANLQNAIVNKGWQSAINQLLQGVQHVPVVGPATAVVTKPATAVMSEQAAKANVARMLEGNPDAVAGALARTSASENVKRAFAGLPLSQATAALLSAREAKQGQ